MRKRVLALSLILALVLGMTAQAAPAKMPRVGPTLSFSGTTATCAVSVIGDKASDTIAVTAKLWKGSTCLKTWTKSGTGRVSISNTVTVTKGQTYKLTADATVNGVKQAQKSTTKTCL